MTQSKLIIAPIKLNNSDNIEYKLVDVFTTTDTMGEINLVSVVGYVCKKELLPLIDSVSKQRILHNILR